MALPLAAALMLAALLGPSPARAAAPVEPYQHNDFRWFRDVLPPGANGHASGPDLAAFLTAGARPRHSDDQLAMYRDLIHAAPVLSPSSLPRYFKDASFGVRPADVERLYTPGGRDDVTVVRDRGFGVAHVYGSTRAGAMFGLGYVAAEDRLFLMDVLRHLGRAQLSSFAGGAPGNRALDQFQWASSPYTEADLERQLDLSLRRGGADAERVRQDAVAYVAGVNRYIGEARLDASKLPGEYAAIERSEGPDDWKLTDFVATASAVAVVFGGGGGGEVASAQLLQAWQERFGRARGTRLWRQFSGLDDPEAPTTVRGPRFEYQQVPRRPDRAANAIPDRGSVTPEPLVLSGVDARATARDARPGAPGLLAFPATNSSALVVSGRESTSGHPLALFGPQVGYFTPQVLMEQDVHAPGIDARGAAFPGLNLYVQMGRGRDYAWSATSAGQDVADTFAVDLCDPAGGPPVQESAHYVFRGQCLAMEELRRTNSWEPTLADRAPAGSQTLRTLRTRLGLVRDRGTIRGRPVAFVELRSTYFHDVDSAAGFSDFNDPEKMRGPADFRRAAAKVGHTFNWLYADDRDIAYFNSGRNPIRPAGVDPILPTRASFEWTGYDPDLWTAAYLPDAAHPQAGNQAFLTSWNNRQARGYGSGYQSRHRVDLLDDAIRRGIAGTRRMTLPQLVDAMADAATVDLRGYAVLPDVLAVLGRQRDPRLAEAIATLAAWRRAGAHRIDRDRDGAYDDADAVTIMDAWWPRLLEAQFKPTMRTRLFEALRARVPFDDPPNGGGQHLGSAYQQGWYGFASKDLRTLLRRPVRGRYARVFCGGGNRARCRRALAESLRAALAVPREQLYDDPRCTADGRRGEQWCHDSIVFRPLGAITQPPIHWQNRPTYQQAVEVQAHRAR
jgi:acyl-homoserine lactone acylase PvdQ